MIWDQSIIFSHFDLRASSSLAVEGIHFIDAYRVVVTSDKSKPTQPHNCMHKDQSIAIMALPKYTKSPK